MNKSTDLNRSMAPTQSVHGIKCGNITLHNYYKRMVKLRLC